MGLNNIVNVQITRQSTGVTQKSFWIILILSANATFSNRIKYYENAEDVAADLVNGTSDYEYKMAEKIFLQNPRPEKIALGRIDGGDANYSVTLEAIKAENPDFYFVISNERTAAKCQEIANWVEQNGRFYVVTSDEADAIDKAVTDNTDTSVAKMLFENGYTKSMYVYKSSEEYIDAAVCSVVATKTPGTYTFAFKSLVGITADSLTSTQKGNLADKNANWYEEVGGRNIIYDGKCASGDYADLMIFIDWLTARIQERVYTSMVNLDKIPYNDTGILIVVNALKEPLETALTNGALSPMAYDEDKNQIGGYAIDIPKYEDIPSADKTNRILNDVKFTAWYSGAIHKVVIKGVVTL